MWIKEETDTTYINETGIESSPEQRFLLFVRGLLVE
jgi:hypothetical protein